MKQTTINDCRIMGMRKFAVMALLCVVCAMVDAKPNKVDSLSAKMMSIENSMAIEQREIAILQKEVEVCEKSLRCIDEHVDRANESVSNQIAASSHTMQAWGWVLALLGVVFAFYINYMWQKSKTLKDKTTQQLQQTETKLKELQVLYADIQKNSQKIYAQLRKEETKMQVERLQEVPEDISNMLNSLLARKLEPADFGGLYKAYTYLIERYMQFSDAKDVAELRTKSHKFSDKEESYMILFTQHFLTEAIRVPEIREYMQSHFGTLCLCFYRNDAEKCTDDLKIGVSTLDSETRINILSAYIIGLSETNFSSYSVLYDNLLDGLSIEELYGIWKKVSKETKEAKTFANSCKEKLQRLASNDAITSEIEKYATK